jgi:hypothetical protein
MKTYRYKFVVYVMGSGSDSDEAYDNALDDLYKGQIFDHEYLEEEYWDRDDDE